MYNSLNKLLEMINKSKEYKLQSFEYQSQNELSHDLARNKSIEKVAKF